MKITEIVTIIISSIAAVVSIIALVKTHYDKFRPVFSCGDVAFKINQWENGNEKWYQLFIFLPLKIANSSNSIGKIQSFRIKFVYGKRLVAQLYEILPVGWEIISENEKSFSYKHKGNSLDKILKNEWCPLGSI